MGLISFLKEAGEKMMHRGGADDAPATVPVQPSVQNGCDMSGQTSNGAN